MILYIFVAGILFRGEEGECHIGLWLLDILTGAGSVSGIVVHEH